MAIDSTNPTLVLRRGLYRSRRVIKESNILVISDQPSAMESAVRSILNHRRLLEDHIRRHPLFKHSLHPLKVEETAPRIVKLAASTAEAAGVGPMAAVPGSLADLAVDEMVRCGTSINLVENGGEIAALSNEPLNIAIYAGESSISDRIGFHLTEDDSPIGIATSSATVGHALSFGEADAAVVVADSASMADAAATAVCNAVVGSDVEASVQAGLEAAESISNIRGALVVRGGCVGTVGRLPRLLKFRGDLDAISDASLLGIAGKDLPLPSLDLHGRP
jgi:ApbE superfamily uncharacterized protein (UPF0280 family)